MHTKQTKGDLWRGAVLRGRACLAGQDGQQLLRGVRRQHVQLSRQRVLRHA